MSACRSPSVLYSSMQKHYFQHLRYNCIPQLLQYQSLSETMLLFEQHVFFPFQNCSLASSLPESSFCTGSVDYICCMLGKTIPSYHKLNCLQSCRLCRLIQVAFPCDPLQGQCQVQYLAIATKYSVPWQHNGFGRIEAVHIFCCPNMTNAIEVGIVVVDGSVLIIAYCTSSNQFLQPP